MYVDEDYSVKPPQYGTIDLLMQSLTEHGPLITEATMGPNAYTASPFKLREKTRGQDIYGWKPGEAKEDVEAKPFILLGARKVGDKAYVY